MVPDGLGDVLVAGYDKVLLEYGERVHLDVVAAALAALELEVELLRGAVLLAEETGTGRERGFIGLGRAGSYAAGVELKLGFQAAHFYRAYPHRLQGPEIGRGKGPHGQLVLYEFC